ncbi:D-alanine--poly(phosphoribitol) ligase subunit DltA [Lactobacillus xylocopicola]|uniref:D-alanine--D-alanyl carrier protein ligase n=1 Tax=Lactobacillus xylocopicola TaxID=2976676 RepID=A0ABN6SLJ1_9LACO|nr:D-alanine--poly(phosphoribitol) ligase subunit DltA [Lactobacillus xylocopicola]BDR61222.1 D-alanine--poly(phosphoribitol) ligase subunit 1 [Lactobacillus xylocopicola]
MIKDVIKEIDQVASADPERVVFDYLGQTNTYADLKQRSDAWAHKIASLDIRPGSPVMVWGGQDFEMLASFLGCVKTGHAYIPIVSYSNAERIVMIQEVAEAEAILAIDELPDINLSGLKVVKPEEVKVGNYAIDPANFVTGDDNFYIIFTSGTSGKPKGVQISHNNLLSYLNWEMTDFGLPEHPDFLVQVPYSFDVSVMSIYPVLLGAGKLVVLPHELTQNFAQLFQTLPKLQFNIWVSTPSFARMCFLDKTFDEAHHPNLSQFLFCGEELPHTEVVMLKERFPHARIFNTYGPTETTVAVTQVEITDKILQQYDRLPIGKVKEDMRITIDKSKGNRPDMGEIIITGPATSKGYINNPTKTAQAFFKKPGDQYLSHRSGDEGFFKDGLLFYRGRIDFQIKFNGYRIELEEINHYISRNQFVDHGVAAPKYNKDHTVKQIVAEIELKDGVADRYSEAEITKAIRADLAKDLMPYMIPQRFIYREKLPVSQNGKVDIKAVIKEVNE